MEKSENYRKAENYRPFIKKKVEAEAISDNDIIKALEGHLSRGTSCSKCVYIDFEKLVIAVLGFC